jgi:hypothetical protein
MNSRVALLLALFAGNASACLLPPPEVVREHKALLTEASSVVLVGVRGSSTRAQPCEFFVIQSLKGPVPADLSVVCRLPTDDDWMTDLEGHAATDFWDARSGRLGLRGDCSVLPPAFLAGKQYLLLLGVRPDTKQFEQVAASGDRWLKYAQQHLSSASELTPNPSVKGTSRKRAAPYVER